MATCAAAPPPEQIEDVEPHLGVLTYEELVRERVYDPELNTSSSMPLPRKPPTNCC